MFRLNYYMRTTHPKLSTERARRKLKEKKHYLKKLFFKSTFKFCPKICNKVKTTTIFISFF